MQETFKPVLSSSHTPGELPALSINSISTQTKGKRALSSRMESHQAHYAPVALGLDSKQTFRRAPKVCPHLNLCYWNSTGTGSLGILYHSKIFVLSSLAAQPATCQTYLAIYLTSQLPSGLLAAAGCSSQGYKGVAGHPRLLAGHFCLCFHTHLCWCTKVSSQL